MNFTKTFTLLAGIALIFAVPSSAQKVINVPTPVVGNVPAAIAVTGQFGSGWVTIHRNGTLAVATTTNEIKVWTLPDGKLIYRLQKAAVADYWKDFRDNGGNKLLFTGDEKYMYPYFKSEVAETDAGELLPSGALRDSILNGSYDARRGYYGYRSKLPANEVKKLTDMRTSPLAIKRDYSDWASDESINIIELQKDPFNKDVLHIIYTQSHCGDKDWIKNTLKQNVKEVRERQKKSEHCHYYDAYWATYNVTTGSGVVHGRLTDSTESGAAAFESIESATISPFGDVAVVTFDRHYPALFAQNGRLLWKAPPKVHVTFDHFDGVGNAVLKQEAFGADGKTSITVHDAATGDIVTEYRLPGIHSNIKIGLVEQMGLISHISRTADDNLAVTFHHPETGKMELSLTDDEATKKFAQQYQADAAAFAAQKEAREQAARRSQEEAYRQSVADHNSAYAKDVAERNGTGKAVDPNACATCNGTGWVMRKGFLYNKTTREYSSGAGSGSVNYRTTTTPVYSNYESRQVCSACSGRGKTSK